MYCSTCGATIPSGRRTCDTCGASTGSRAGVLRRASGGSPVGGSEPWGARVLCRCPRCGYRGEGLPYFSRGVHMAALVGSTVLTMGVMGAGGLIYYLLRRDHQVCPRCGRAWGREGELAAPRPAPAPASAPAGVVADPLPGATGRETMQRTASVGLFLLAAILLTVGIAEGELAPALLSAVAGGGGVLLHQLANQERQRRRASLLSALQLPVLQLASDRGGRLTVTEVAAQLGWTLRRAERVLQSLDDGMRVNSEVTDEGVIVYEFRELMLDRDRQRDPPRLSDPAS